MKNKDLFWLAYAIALVVWGLAYQPYPIWLSIACVVAGVVLFWITLANWILEREIRKLKASIEQKKKYLAWLKREYPEG